MYDSVAAGRIGPSGRPTPPPQLLAGHLHDPIRPDASAWGIYANLLLHPSDAAALQLAWIDRGSGSGSASPAEWLRRLGVGDGWIRALRRPVPPLRT